MLATQTVGADGRARAIGSSFPTPDYAAVPGAEVDHRRIDDPRSLT